MRVGSFILPRWKVAVAMIDTRLIVQADGVVSSMTRLAAGEYLAHLELQEPPGGHGKPFILIDFPMHDIGWEELGSLRREEMYGDDGR